MEGKNEHDAGPIATKNMRKYSKHSEADLVNYHLRYADCFGKFTENQNYLQDQLEYPRNGSEPGLLLIFNQESFGSENERRNGSFKDVDDILLCFNRLGFNVDKEHIFEDLTKEQIFASVDKILSTDLTEVNSVLVFIMTHGECSNFLSTKSGSFLADHLWVKFAECKQLQNKPKMFIVQACKGNNDTPLSSGNNPSSSPLVPLSTFASDKIYPDMVIVYSTMEGKYAYRHNINGAWLIQELCKNFTAYGRRDDVLTILSRVTKCICKNYFEMKEDVVKQIPVVVSTLSKKFYLNRNKDRHFILTLLEKQKELQKVVKSISDKVDSIHGGDEDKKNGKDRSRNTK